MIMSTEPVPDLNDIFTSIAARALAKGGVRDAAWINAVANEHRKAFADLGLTIPPGGMVEVITAEPNPDLPPPPVRAPEEVKLSNFSRALMFFAVLEQPDSPIWIADCRALDVTSGALRTLVSNAQWALALEWRTVKPSVIELARVRALYLPQNPDNPTDGQFVTLTPYWLAGYRPLTNALHEAVAAWIAKRGNADIRRCGPWWPKIAEVRR